MTRTATTIDTYRLTPRVTGFRLRVPGEEFAFDPGQHTTVRFEAGGTEVVRPYSPTTLPGTDEFALAIKRYDDGLASSYMHTRSPGDEVEIGEFEGNLALENPDRDIALLASGTGLTPLLSILRQYARIGNGDAHLVFGERTADSIFHRSTLDELAAMDDSVAVTYTLSDPEWSWLGRVGYVQEHLEDLFDEFETRDFYVCGVPGMVVETTDRLRELGAPEERIHSEGWESDAVDEED
ncbi:NADH-cytochrome b5 reductase [Natrinema sp. 1APR25-10V2]|uniref:ferredoxin--NADP reductase n=1 Tax=Natrinema sp. 1APR25-10V2 TaxID=2951081 RepID=UPI002874172C|nr:NADH-cytochrome b5 reductase [Natrinema sp. 1APR25-10V2]MDS0475541.1 cytochrome-b5 reductase [Natrinema sp. 1APR25-10V2]